MKKRILCAVLSVMLLASLITLPAQAAAKPAFQWLVDFTKREGLYDAANKTYAVSWAWDESQDDRYIVLEYDLSDGNLYCWCIVHVEELCMVLTPNLDVPYQVFFQDSNTLHSYQAEYRVYPGTFTESTKLQHSQYYGHEVYLRDVDVSASASLELLVQVLNNLMILDGSSYRIKDLGFTKFTRHSVHVYGDPVVEGEFHCGNNTYYRRYCLVCGTYYVYNQWENHIQGAQVWEKEPTCTEWGNYYYTCARCGERIPGAGKYVEPLGHDWALISLDAPVNDEAHVQGQFRCKRCSEEKDDEYCAADFFKDMPVRGNWAHTPIDWAFANGITTGTSETKFSPDKGCTRGQVVTFLWRAAGCPEPEKTNTSFTDLKPGAFYEKAVAWAVEEGITNGKSATTFAPDATCTRGQIVTFLWRFKGSSASKNTESVFTDLKPGAFYEKAVAWAVRNNVTNGMTSTTFSPDGTCTRAQIVTFLYRAQNVSTQSAGGLVGVSIPTAALMRWKNDGEALKTQIENLGYDVTLQFADNMPDKQIEQIENMLADGAKVIVVAAVYDRALVPVLAKAKASGVTVIAYDRPIGSDSVSYYTTFDIFSVGAVQGRFIVDRLDLAHAGDKTYNIELIGGSPDDGNAYIYYDGAMSELRKYIDAGTLKVVSGQTSFEDVATLGWSSENAQERFESLLSTYYTDKQLDAVMCSNDSTAQGVAVALENAYKNDVYPILTGQDCDFVSVKNMLDDKQAMSVFKDTRILVSRTAEMVDAVMKGDAPATNAEYTTRDGSLCTYPAFFCEPAICTRDNIKELLIDSGFYTWEELTR